MLDHVSIPVDDLDRAAAFYDAVLATLGLVRRKERPGAIGYGPPSRAAPVFWRLSLAARERARVRVSDFTSAFSGFVLDLDGYKIEAVCRSESD